MGAIKVKAISDLPVRVLQANSVRAITTWAGRQGNMVAMGNKN